MRSKNIHIAWLTGMLFILTQCISVAASLPWKLEGTDFLSGSFDVVVPAANGDITLPPPTWPNLIQNGSFEVSGGAAADADKWTEGVQFTRDATYKYKGDWAMRFDTAGGAGPFGCPYFAAITVVPTHNYRFSANFFVTSHSAGNWTFLDLNDVTNDPEIYAGQTGTWHTVTRDWVCPGGLASVTPRIAAHGGTGIICWIDDVRFVDMGGSIVQETQGIYTSAPFGCDAVTTFGNISWEADIPAGCSITFYTSSAASEGALGGTWDLAGEVTANAGEIEIVSTPNQYIKFKAVLKTSGNAVPVLKKVTITPATKALSAKSSSSSYVSAIRPGDIVNFTAYFNVPMSSDPADNCTVTIVPEAGTPFTLNNGGIWADSYTYVTANTASIPAMPGGYAQVDLTGGKTATNGYALLHSFMSFVLVDPEPFVSGDKLSFFPDPFSPNGDGKADEAKLVFDAGSAAVDVIIKIYDLHSKFIKTVFDGKGVMGSQTASWDGMDSSGKPCPVGIYIFQITKGTKTQNGTLVLTK